MKTNLKPENQTWPREDAKNTKQDGLILNVERRSDLFPPQSILRSALGTLCVLLWQNALADVHYVDVNSANATPPYSNWTTAATNIQAAVDVAVAGDEIVVTNGVYGSIRVEKPLTVRSINGPQFTVIDARNSTYFIGRCAYLTNDSSLSGFTLTNGVTAGGGFGLSAGGGGVYGGTLNNCTLTGNQAEFYGGAAAACTLNNCTLTGNYAGIYGGGAYICTLNNCTLAGNSVGAFGEGGGGAFNSTLNNCTLTGNSAKRGGGAFNSRLNNCIVYFNTAAQQGTNYDSFSTLIYSCTTPQPTTGVGNITNAPLFVDQASGNLRLQSNSPCINAGNNSYVTNATDLDGNPRIAGGTVDVGAYEFQSPASMISYAWLQQFNLPIDPSADTADPDGDRMNNWREWRCGTDPINALSVLRMLSPAVAGSDLLVRWESVADRTYFLERGPAASSPFTPLATGIPGQPGMTTYTDTNAVGVGPWFYRVGVGIP